MPLREMPIRLVLEKENIVLDVTVPDELWQVVEMCWAAPNDRPGIDQIIQHLEDVNAMNGIEEGAMSNKRS